MHILEIENLINRLQKSQISLIEILRQDAEFCALTELQFRESAAIPFAVVRGAKLRRKLNRKFGGRPVSGDMYRLDRELAEIEQTIASVVKAKELPVFEKPQEVPAREKQQEMQAETLTELLANVPVEKQAEMLAETQAWSVAELQSEPQAEPADEQTEVVESGGMSISRLAADRAEALAKLSNLKFTRSEAEIIAVGAPSIEDIQRINIEKTQPVETDISSDIAKADDIAGAVEISEAVEISAVPEVEEIAVQNVHFLPTPSALASLGRGIAFALVALITIVTISSSHPEPAKASKQIFNSLYSAALTCCNIEVSAANLR